MKDKFYNFKDCHIALKMITVDGKQVGSTCSIPMNSLHRLEEVHCVGTAFSDMLDMWLFDINHETQDTAMPFDTKAWDLSSRPTPGTYMMDTKSFKTDEVAPHKSIISRYSTATLNVDPKYDIKEQLYEGSKEVYGADYNIFYFVRGSHSLRLLNCPTFDSEEQAWQWIKDNKKEIKESLNNATVEISVIKSQML
jgi:hypothetical protein